MNFLGVSALVIDPNLSILIQIGLSFVPTSNRGTSNSLHTLGVQVEETRLLVGCTKDGVVRFMPDQTGSSVQQRLSLLLTWTMTGLHLKSVIVSPAVW